MDDAEKERRPNANYKLSKNLTNPEEEANLTFYYNREKRLEKSPQIVKDLYKEGKKQYKFNLLQPLVADKPRAMLFFTIIIMSAAIMALSLLGQFDKSVTLDGNKLEITGTAFEDMTIVVLRKIVKKTSAYSGAVDIAVSVPVKAGEEEFPVFYHRVFFTKKPEEEYRFSVPLNSPQLLIVFQSENSTATLKIKPE